MTTILNKPGDVTIANCQTDNFRPNLLVRRQLRRNRRLDRAA